MIRVVRIVGIVRVVGVVWIVGIFFGLIRLDVVDVPGHFRIVNRRYRIYARIRIVQRAVISRNIVDPVRYAGLGNIPLIVAAGLDRRIEVITNEHLLPGNACRTLYAHPGTGLFAQRCGKVACLRADLDYLPSVSAVARLGAADEDLGPYVFIRGKLGGKHSGLLVRSDGYEAALEVELSVIIKIAYFFHYGAPELRCL